MVPPIQPRAHHIMCEAGGDYPCDCPPSTKPQVARVKSNRETMSAGGGAEVEPAIAHRAQERRYDLLLAVVKHIPKRHRIGWLHALARRYATPFTAEPTAAELDYLAWSEARHTSPKAKANQPPQTIPAQVTDRSLSQC